MASQSIQLPFRDQINLFLPLVEVEVHTNRKFLSSFSFSFFFFLALNSTSAFFFFFNIITLVSLVFRFPCLRLAHHHDQLSDQWGGHVFSVASLTLVHHSSHTSFEVHMFCWNWLSPDVRVGHMNQACPIKF